MSQARVWDEDALRQAGYVRACAQRQVPTLMPLRLTLGGRGVLVCRDDEGVYALDELCPHQLKSMAFGWISQGALTCPHHDYMFDLKTGRHSTNRCAPLGTHDVVVHEQSVWVRVS